MLPGQKISPEHKAKMQAARARYWAERKAFPPKNQELKEGQIVVAGKGENTVQVLKQLPTNRYTHRDYVTATIANKRKKLIEAQLDVAIGYSYVNEDGKKIYTKPPNASTGEYLLNQLIGKPKESIEVKEEIRLSVDI